MCLYDFYKSLFFQIYNFLYVDNIINFVIEEGIDRKKNKKIKDLFWHYYCTLRIKIILYRI
jgi:hypothetical protein